jgi:hypothetical protein
LEARKKRQKKFHFGLNFARRHVQIQGVVPALASPILGRVARRIAADWQRRCGHRVALLEKFVERGRPSQENAV